MADEINVQVTPDPEPDPTPPASDTQVVVVNTPPAPEPVDPSAHTHPEFEALRSELAEVRALATPPPAVEPEPIVDTTPTAIVDEPLASEDVETETVRSGVIW